MVVAPSREVRVGKIDMVFSHCIAITIEHTHHENQTNEISVHAIYAHTYKSKILVKVDMLYS